MSKIKSFNELRDLIDELKPNLSLRNNTIHENGKKELLVCGDTGCRAANSMPIIDSLKSEIKNAGLEDIVSVSLTGCFGFCAQGPIVKVHPDNVFYVKVSADDAKEIVQEHLVKGNVVDRLLYLEASENKKVHASEDISFYKQQMRIALHNCGYINPEKVEDYIANDGYLTLGKCITELTPEQVIEEVKVSGLRGRGGAGFPTGIKWEATRKSISDQKYVVCNADEGDPGAFMDRSILEGDPHKVLEAMAICGYAVGSDTGYIYIRAEYPLAIERLQLAISQAKNLGLLGNNILGTDFNFNIELKYGAGAFVCGEGTALMRSIEGNRGEPRMKTYSSTKKGLWDVPTCANNVETFANIPPILSNGGNWYKNIGTEKSSGTKVFALGGKINNVGLVEIPMGTTLRDVIYNIGGGIPDGREFKAVLTGGPSGGCIPSDYLDTPIDFDNLSNLGSMMGSGGMLILDDTDCMVDIAKFFLGFTVEESCGKCTPCRIGNKRLLEILTKITDGKGTEQDLIDLENLSKTIVSTSLCGLGKSAPNPVLSTLNYFYDEYKSHVIDKKCPSGKCQALLNFVITDSCIGCTKCSKVCPAGCISGSVKEKHEIDVSKCLKCGACMDNCKFNAIIKR
ncbi:NADH-quinone oxidoreductase subunit NuoF [Paraclostridium bifermentans]|jgi:NADH-quinone oxidoreductase subunit F|uniref:NADH-quinone oxidoreductase subunit NuoF n=1 Tax=Paraclostridium bifermentans TaxID=1490 RepID=UPI000DF82C54|nr:NADH-quinone oxidoreductase subunit NuoF [Paraclostridium bifermentans]RDC51097.1 NADH-quinone oxidoreductase subunit NuoF [Acinetobacter sp. RIT592]MBS5953712.1 NADH-quinone oxidoreductase subunit NuoF [Paraclostridium bifermentans]MBS6507062.1 NADH-quinone oxidoreductase subunit NuoF [Paraclostridium bifermentans]MBU5288573.1 NADH-quinone oxidoreductase subunit NuoF [Paraclostridium bifermentans]MDU3335694.1 NADH-quinone oxidoreductase subunit NuoF [Paraclostridium bifermentans]